MTEKSPLFTIIDLDKSTQVNEREATTKRHRSPEKYQQYLAVKRAPRHRPLESR
jgi:hypothetical protein